MGYSDWSVISRGTMYSGITSRAMCICSQLLRHGKFRQLRAVLPLNISCCRTRSKYTHVQSSRAARLRVREPQAVLLATVRACRARR